MAFWASNGNLCKTFQTMIIYHSKSMSLMAEINITICLAERTENLYDILKWEYNVQFKKIL